MNQAAKSLKDIRALALGDTITAGPLLGGLTDRHVTLRLVEVETSGTRVFEVRYFHVLMGQAVLKGQKWSISWK